MRTADGCFWIPILPSEFAEKTKGIPRVEWPKDVETEYRRLHAEFTASKAEFIEWIRKDRNSQMNKTAKLIASFVIDRLNFDTGRCDPSHQYIADELFLSVRTVERTIPRIARSGWMIVTRRGKTTTNFYRFRVAVTKVNDLLDATLDLKERRLEARAKRMRQWSDPTKVADHEPSIVAGHEPTEMTGKPMKGTCEEEPLNKKAGSEGEGLALRTHARAYGAAKLDDRLIPFSVPDSEDDMEEMVMGWLEGHPPRAVLVLFDELRERLSTGTFTPAELDVMLGRAA